MSPDWKRARKPVEISAVPFVELGMVLARPLARTSITPNQLSFLALISGLLGAILIATANFAQLPGLTPYTQALIGAVLGLVFFELDVLDGHLARAKGMTSRFGAWLDTVSGMVTIQLTLLAVIYYVNSPIGYILGPIAAIAYPMHFLFIHQYQNAFSDVQKKRKESKLNTTNYFLRYGYGQGIFYPLVFLGIIFNIPLAILVFYATFGNLYWLGILALQAKTFW